MKHKTVSLFWLRLLALALPLVLGWQPSGAVSAYKSILPSFQPIPAGAEQNCPNLDIIFLVDQSSSMTVNDPTIQREWAVKGMIDFLVDLAIDQCPGSFHRLAVLSFGSTIRVDLPLTIIAPTNYEEGQQLRDVLEQNILADDLGASDPMKAFQQAAGLLHDAETPPPTDGLRKQAIIMITDVGSYTTDYLKGMENNISSSFPFDLTLLDKESCLRSVTDSYDGNPPDEEIKRCSTIYQPQSDAYQNSTYIWFLILQSLETLPQAEFDTYSRISQQHAGSTIYLRENRADIPLSLRKILSDLAPIPNHPPCCDIYYVVNPFLRQIRITVYRINESDRISISYVDAGGVQHEIKNGQSGATGGFSVAEYYTYGPNERYVFDYPYPGIWMITSDFYEGIDLYYEMPTFHIEPALHLPAVIPQYDFSPYYDAENPIYLEFQMLDDNGRIIQQPDSPIFAVSVQAAITDPGGNRTNYSIEWDSVFQCFRSIDPLRVPIGGTYLVEVIGTTHRHSGEPQVNTTIPDEVFTTSELFHEEIEFSVVPVKSLRIQVLSPEPGKLVEPPFRFFEVPPPVIRFPLNVQVTDTHGLPIEDAALTISFYDLVSQSITTFSLNPDLNNAGIYTGEFELPAGNILDVMELSARIDLLGEANNKYRLIGDHEFRILVKNNPWNRVESQVGILTLSLIFMILIIWISIKRIVNAQPKI